MDQSQKDVSTKMGTFKACLNLNHSAPDASMPDIQPKTEILPMLDLPAPRWTPQWSPSWHNAGRSSSRTTSASYAV